MAKAGAKGEENLNYLASLGFALSMDHVETLALDFARLKNARLPPYQGARRNAG